MKKLALILLAVFSLAVCTGYAEMLFSSDPDAIEEAAKSVLMLEVFDANNEPLCTGSGFVAFDNRTIVTNYHVIDGADWILANSDAGYQYMVTKVLIADEDKDLAICSFMSPTDLVPLEFNSEGELKRAEGIVAIGSPRGITNTVSLGNISALYTDNSVSWIQFTAPISSGSSGGALFDNSGKVIGVTSATLTDAQNINFAVHISEVEQLYRNWNGQELAFDEYQAMLNTTPTPTPVPTATPTPAPVVKPIVYATPVPVPNGKEYDIVAFGDSGKKVQKLQQALIDLGYLDGYADGIYGRMTTEAIALFNETNGLGPYDFVCRETLRLLYDGNPYEYKDNWMALTFNKDVAAEWEKLDNDILSIHFNVTSRAKQRIISSFEIYVYATDIEGKIVCGNQYYYKNTERMLNPGETTYSDAILLPECSQIYRIWCGIHKVEYQDGTTYTVPNYYDSRISYFIIKGRGWGKID